MNRLEGDNLWNADVNLLQLFFKMAHVVVAEDVLGRATVANAFNHGRVVARVGEDVTSRQHLGECAQRRVVSDVTGSEEQSRVLPVQVCQLSLQLFVVG